MMFGLGLGGLGLGVMGVTSGGGSAPVLTNTNGVITVTTAGYPSPPHLANINGIITAEAEQAASGGGGAPSLPMPLWNAALAAQAAGTQNAKVIFIGDSTTAGAKAYTNAPAYAGARVYSWPMVAVADLPSVNRDIWAGGNGVPIADLSSYNPRFSAVGSGWLFNQNTLGGAYLSNSSTTDVLSFSPDLPFDTVEIWSARNGGLGIMTVNIDGGTNTAIDQNGASSYIKTVITAPLGLHTINFARVSGLVFLGAIVPYASTEKCILAYQCGVNGQRIASPIGGSPIGPLECFKAHAPDLTVICLTINDASDNTDTATFEARTQTLINAAKLTGDVVLMTGVPSGTIPLAYQEAKVASYRALAGANGINLIDMYAEWGSYADAVALGRMADALHPNGVGYAAIAATAAKLLVP